MFPESLADDFETWLIHMTTKEPERRPSEPERLLTAKEYRAAVIAAVALLESRLAQHLHMGARPSRATSPRELLRRAAEVGILEPAEERRLTEAIRLRNAALHQRLVVSRSQARDAVQAIMAVIERMAR
jgi:uncharacterized protein YutE (UPF0331/DUF86 family)